MPALFSATEVQALTPVKRAEYVFKQKFARAI